MTRLSHEFERRLAAGYTALEQRAFDEALGHMEAAHILGQAHTWRHIRSHVALLRWGWAHRNGREFVGQVGRLVGATLVTWAWVPRGTPGSTRVGAFSPHPVPADLEAWLSGPSR